MAEPPELNRVTERWRARAAEDDAAFFRRYGLDGVRDFRSRLGRLGGAALWFGRRAILWRNPAARIVLPDPATRAILAALEADPRP
jgi:hypothetical protein